jgi:hypothetical protein
MVLFSWLLVSPLSDGFCELLMPVDVEGVRGTRTMLFSWLLFSPLFDGLCESLMTR